VRHPLGLKLSGLSRELVLIARYKDDKMKRFGQKSDRFNSE